MVERFNQTLIHMIGTLNNKQKEDWKSHLLEPYKDKFTKTYEAMLEELEEHINASDDRNYDVYSGTAGYALLYLHLYEINPDKGDHSYLHKPLDFIKGPIDNLKEQKAGFLCGDSGPYALAVVIYSLLGDAQNYQKYLKKLIDMTERVIWARLFFFPAGDQLSNGRMGLLYSLLFIQRKLGEDTIRKDRIFKIQETI